MFAYTYQFRRVVKLIFFVIYILRFKYFVFVLRIFSLKQFYRGQLHISILSRHREYVICILDYIIQVYMFVYIFTMLKETN